jgi:VanZ family protein
MRYALPALLWTACVLAASSDLFSANHTGSVLQSVVIALAGHPLSDEALELVQFVIRKLAHLTEYGLLGWLWFRALRRGAQPRWTLRWSLLAVVIAIAVAITDEVHQSFVPSRTASPLDVVIDACGATLAQLIVRLRTAK